MPETGRRRRPQVATCEELDEGTGTVLPGSRTTANVSIKRSEHDLVAGQRESKSIVDGVDSGYASRADTLVSEPTSTRQKTKELRIEPAPVPLERERQPYHMPQTAHVKPPTRRQSSSQAKDSVPEPRPSKVRQVHERGTCQICDHFGYHADKKDILRASSMAPPQPPSPTSTRHVVGGRSKDDEAIYPKTKRSSSMRQQRPLTVVTNNSNPPQYIQQPMYAVPSMFAQQPWTTPVTPVSVQYAPGPYPYVAGPAPPTMPTPATPQFGPYQHPYFEPPSLPEPRSAKPSRRSSPVRRTPTYGNPVIKQGHFDSGFAVLERNPSKENRPALTSHRSNRSIDQDRAVMPPPPKPQASDGGLSRRSSNRRSNTYHPIETKLRERSSREPVRFEDDDDEYLELRPTISNRGRQESPSRPPNSYRAPAIVDPRPALQRKSFSYSTPDTVTKVASSKSNSHRRTTMPSVPLEQKEADAEAYQQKRNSNTANLTIEALRDLNLGTSSSRSETGSSYSHKSHQSSKDSSRGRTFTSGASTSITLPGGLNVNIPANYKPEGRPVSINFGDITLSMNAQGKEIERPREQKRIERAPSVASKASRRSIASSNVSNSDIPKKTSRRPSQLEERTKLNQQHSRTPSATGHSYDYSVTSRRQSVDLAKYEDFYGA